ncbi:MAG: hypothetical protein K8I27_06835 [Planctomycetes bacterium]|nr:hypothetical protein [Planctomycetota bacterium]
MRYFVLMLALLFAVPAFAQTRETELRDWFNKLPESRQNELKNRLRALKRLPKERQAEVLKAAREGRPVLTDAQRDNIRKLGKMDYLERVRLYTTAAELQVLRRTRGKEFDDAMQLEGHERVKALREMLHEQRMMHHMRNMPDEQREALRGMSPVERQKAMRQWFKEDSERRMEALEGFHPRIAELRQAAADGDKDAKRQLRRTIADLRTLDMLLQRLEPEARESVMSKISELTIEQAADEVRRALQKQWQNEMRNRPNRGPRPEERGSMRPDRNGIPDRPRRREQ